MQHYHYTTIIIMHVNQASPALDSFDVLAVQPSTDKVFQVNVSAVYICIDYYAKHVCTIYSNL